MRFLSPTPPASPHRPSLVGGGGVWSWERLAAEVARRGQELAGELRPGGIRALALEPSPRGILELLATWEAGAVAAPLSPQLTPTEARRARETLAQADRAGDLPPGTAAVLWTSGTTGSPRGVVLTWEGLRANAEASRERLSLQPSDVWLASLSLAHVGGLALVVRAILLGCTLVAEGPFELTALLRGLRGEGVPAPVTHASLVPTQLLRLLDAWGDVPPPPSFRCALLGGAPTPAPLLSRALDSGWPVALTYGMTEMTSQVATAPPARVRQKPGTVGTPLAGVEIALSGEGEILARGLTRAAAYLGTEDPLADGGGWYHTGDLGRLDAEGDLWIVGRRSDRIMSGGVTVDPYEVEATLRRHPFVRDACVVGIPDPEWGERVAALVVPAGAAPGGAASDTKGLDLPSLSTWAAERLGPARRPRRWALVDELPLNRNGKVDREAVRSRLVDPAAEGGR